MPEKPTPSTPPAAAADTALAQAQAPGPMPPWPPARRIGVLQPLAWLVLAWQDIGRTPGLSLAHGLLVALVGGALLWAGQQHFGWMVGALSGLLVLGPVVATSLYTLSRAAANGQRGDVALLRRTWRSLWAPVASVDARHADAQTSKDAVAGIRTAALTAATAAHTGMPAPGGRSLLGFGALLALAGTGWVVVSASLITLRSPVPVRTPLDFLQHVVAAPDGQLFALWLALGTVLAAPIFCSSVITIPLLLDRRVGLWPAVYASWNVVLHNPVPMALWAGLIVAWTTLGVASMLLGLVLVMPMLGHASWHAYRDLVDVSDFPLREATASGARP